MPERITTLLPTLLLALLLPLLSTPPAMAQAKDEAALERELLSGEAWIAYCDRMKAIGLRILEDDFPGTPRERAEGFRHLARVAIMGLEWGLDHDDPEHPAFYRNNDRFNHWGGPNVDNTYLRARIRGDSTYRITGNISTIEDLIISVQNGDMHMEKYSVAGDLDRAQLEVGPDGSIEVFLSPEPPKPGKSWIQIPPDADHVNIRQYIVDWDRQTPAVFLIERLGSEGVPPAPLSPARVARGLEAAGDWLESSVVYWNAWLAGSVKDVPPNRLKAATKTPGGSDDIAYGFGHFDLQPDEALIVETKRPDAQYWGIQWYTFGWYEEPDFLYRQTSLNNRQARVDADGRVRFVFSASDPGVPNWIDTAGHQKGQITYRWIWSKDRPVPTAKRVKLADVRKSLPKDTPTVSPEERRKQLAKRALQVQRRFNR